jgi:4-hydroxy-tetrahydrodipicolinate reductase
MSIRVVVNGANGRLGQLIVKTLTEHPDFMIAGVAGRQDDLALMLKETHPDIAIDVTTAEAVLNNAQIMIDAGVRPVIGTSGLMQPQVDQLQEICLQQKLGGIIVPNFSLSAVLLMKYAQEIIKYYPEVEIIEMHHNNKLDSPSGTAVRTAELLAKARQSTPTKKPIHETLIGARGADYQQIPIHSIRLPGLMAHEQVIFGGIGETFSLRYDTVDRQCYMPGVILACQKVIELDQLVYGLEAVL